MRSTSGMPLASNLVCGDGGLADDQPAVVHVIIQAAHDAAGIGLHQAPDGRDDGLMSSQTL